MSKSKKQKTTTAIFENYAAPLRKKLSELNISIGTYIQVKNGGNIVKGYVLPQTEMGDASTLVIKQKNGYNVGIAFTAATELTVLSTDTVSLDSFPELAVKQKKNLPKISLLATGGTIASRLDYLTGGVVMASSPEEIFINLPELFEEVQFKSITSLFQLGSEDIAYKQWQQIAEEVAKEINAGSRGVVIMHGTDMMGYTSAALSFMLHNVSAPIVMTGGQRSSDRGSFDGALNLISAARIAANSDFAHVMVAMHESSNDSGCLLSPGTNVRKMHTSRRDAFKTINADPIARISADGEITQLATDVNLRTTEKIVVKSGYDPKVALVKIYPGADPAILEWYGERGVKGVIIEGTGLGHVPTFPPEDEKERSWIPAITRAIENGMFIGMTSQCLYGRTHPYVYRALRTIYQAGVTFLEDMLPETAFIKLGWAFGNYDTLEEVKHIMTTNIAGEISSRSNYMEAF